MRTRPTAAHVSIALRDADDGRVHITLESDPPVPMKHEHPMTSAQIIALAMLSHGAELLGDSLNVRAVNGGASRGPGAH